ncbi:MAG TPA: pyridoxal phosphate-dependent aminotransferase [Firmicutes bacterium]|nr:pyridoxal phosphate-dependent aminotransferase [Bacillota bacterium]
MQRNPISRRAEAIHPSAVAEMLAMGRKMEAEGIKVYRLVQGEPDFDVPENIREAAKRALDEGYTHYTPNQGMPILREAVADKLERVNRIKAKPESEIIITNGGTLGLYLAVMATVDPGDEVIVLAPYFGPYANMVSLAGGILVEIPMVKSGSHYSPDLDRLSEAVSPRTKVIMINTPSNPSGSVMTRAELLAIGEMACRHDLYIIADEVYERMVFDGHEHVSIASLSEEIKERTITVNSFSKTYAMTGMRLGYNVANPSITKAMSKIYQVSARCAAASTQIAGIEALRGPQTEVERMISRYAERRLMAYKRLSRIKGLHCCMPEGTFYYWLDMTSFGMNSWEIAKYILSEAHVLVTPGSYFGGAGDGFVRLSFATSEENLLAGIDALGDALSRLQPTSGRS